MDVVAEGAETDSDAIELYQLGCEYAQGFYFGEPMNVDEARSLLQASAAKEPLSGEAPPPPRSRQRVP